MQLRGLSKQRFVGYATVLLGMSSITHAQTVPTPEQASQEGLRRQDERTRQQQQDLLPRSDQLKPETQVPTPENIPVDKPCFDIHDIRLSGPDAPNYSWIVTEAKPYLNRCLGVNALAHMANYLNTRLVERGMPTSKISITPQNLQPGILTLTLNIGRVSAVTMTTPGGAADSNWGTFKNAVPISPGDVLNTVALEQGVENLKRLPSQAISTQIKAGDKPDTSVIVIERKPASLSDRTHAGVTLDNSGSTATGRGQLSAYASLDNPLGINDIFTLSGNTNVTHPNSGHRTQSLSANYSVPLDYSLLTLSASHSRFAQSVQGTTVVFVSSGTTSSLEGRLQNTLWRNTSQKLSIYAATSLHQAESFLDEYELVVQRRRTANANLGMSYKYLLSDGSLDADLSYRRGVTWWNAQADLTDTDPNGPTVRPRIWFFNGSFTKNTKLWGTPVQYNASLRLQTTKDHTLTTDQIGIGSRYTVRGFDGSTVLLAESGIALRQDLSAPIRLADGVESTVYCALDYGRVWGFSASSLAGSQLLGTALGLRGKRGPMSFDIAVGAPLSKPNNFTTHTPTAYLSTTYTF